MKTLACFIVAILTCASLVPAQTTPPATVISSQKIWDSAPYNAFTDLIYWHNQFWCVFREASSHLSFDGTLRVLNSPDALTWTSAAVIRPPADDLREGHLSVTPDDHLLIVSAIRSKNPIQSVYTKSDDGRDWSPLTPFGAKGSWVWRLRWNNGTGYGFGYHGGKPSGIDLYTTTDGEHYQCAASGINTAGFLNESDILFRADGSAIALVRRDANKTSPEKTAMFGSAKPPFTQWEWKDTNTPLGSPALLELPDHRIVAAVRLLDEHPRTALCWLDPASGALKEFQTLPPIGDHPGNVAYPGMIFREGMVYVSYYAPENGKCVIYLAKIGIP